MGYRSGAYPVAASTILKKTSKVSWTARWSTAASALIVASSVAYWILRTEQTLDEFVTALSWSSLISIILGGLIAYGSKVSSRGKQISGDVVRQHERESQRLKLATPAIFGMVFAGCGFLIVTVCIEWVAARLG